MAAGDAGPAVVCPQIGTRVQDASRWRSADHDVGVGRRAVAGQRVRVQDGRSQSPRDGSLQRRARSRHLEYRYESAATAAACVEQSGHSRWLLAWDNRGTDDGGLRGTIGAQTMAACVGQSGHSRWLHVYCGRTNRGCNIVNVDSRIEFNM